MTSMRALFIVNPRAGGGAGQRVWNRMAKQVVRNRMVDAVIPATSAEARRIAADAVKAGVRRVIVVGGDGTVGAVAAETALTDTALGVIPAGTGNDFCRNSGIPLNPTAALEVALGTHTEQIDMGRAAGGRLFLNVAGIGFDAEAAVAAKAIASRLRGTLPYVLGALTTMFWYKPIDVDVAVDDHQFSGNAMLIAVANGRYYAGGMQIAPQAHRWDGKLDVCIVGSLQPLELLSLLRQVYTGAHTRHPKVLMLRGEEVRVQVKGESRAHLDGEPLEQDSLAFQVEPCALSVATPASSRQVASSGSSPHGSPGRGLWRSR